MRSATHRIFTSYFNTALEHLRLRGCKHGGEILMTDMPTRFADPGEASSGARINGVIDVPRPGRVAGWAIDRGDPDAAVTIRIEQEGRLVGEVRADAYRPDLERGGIGTGRYGFTFDLDPPVEPGFEFTITATARANDGMSGNLSPIGRAKTVDDANRRLSERVFNELVRLRTGLSRDTNSADTQLCDTIGRIEVVQARLETAMSTFAPPQQAGMGGIMAAVALSLAIGLASLGLGLWSLLAA
jgi:hypothetical protein